MKMNQKQFRIGELATNLNVERFVIRFWEKEFGIASSRSEGGQRFYNHDDLEKFKLIKELLHDKGFTIAGAKKLLQDTTSPTHILGSTKTTMMNDLTKQDDIAEKLRALHKQLCKLYELL